MDLKKNRTYLYLGKVPVRYLRSTQYQTETEHLIRSLNTSLSFWISDYKTPNLKPMNKVCRILWGLDER